MKILRVGDPHTTVANLKDSQKLMDFIIETAFEHKVIRIEFLGDSFHTHAIKRLEVEDFWIRAFKDIEQKLKIPVWIVVGNHDMAGTEERRHINALNVFKPYPNLLIIDRPMIPKVNDEQQNLNIAYIPYIKNIEEFERVSNELYQQGATKTLIAHQTITGCKYGAFYAPDGVDPNVLLQEKVISGHIHTKQQFDKVMYIGSPKWDIMTDANTDKGIWVFDHDKDGSVLESQFISTRGVVTPINKYDVYEGEAVPELDANAKNYIQFHGKTAWITKMKKKYKGLANIKGKPVDRKIAKIDKDKQLTLIEFLNKEFEPIQGVKRTDISDFLEREVQNDL